MGHPSHGPHGQDTVSRASCNLSRVRGCPGHPKTRMCRAGVCNHASILYALCPVEKSPQPGTGVRTQADSAEARGDRSRKGESADAVHKLARLEYAAPDSESELRDSENRRRRPGRRGLEVAAVNCLGT